MTDHFQLSFCDPDSTSPAGEVGFMVNLHVFYWDMVLLLIPSG